MEKLLSTLTELLLAQRAQLTLGEALIAVFDEEESLDVSGFSVAAVQNIVARKDQIIHRFAGVEQKRRTLAAHLGFLISLDMRGSEPTLGHLVAALGVYSNNVRKVLDGPTLDKVLRAIEIYSDETVAQMAGFAKLAQRIQRNQRIVGRLRESINRSVRFFEQACSAIDTSYDKGGKLKPDSQRSRRQSHVAVKA